MCDVFYPWKKIEDGEGHEEEEQGTNSNEHGEEEEEGLLWFQGILKLELS
jgi:hypothetical protein